MFYAKAFPLHEKSPTAGRAGLAAGKAPEDRKRRFSMSGAVDGGQSLHPAAHDPLIVSSTLLDNKKKGYKIVTMSSLL